LTGLPPWDTLLGWVAEGQQRTEDAAAGLDDARLRERSRLAGWSRGHVLSHLARNADALVNLLAWARTGVESRMYASGDDREQGISAGAGRGLAEQLGDLAASGSRFVRAAQAVPEARRSFTVLSAQGRQIPAHEVPWLRVREVWLHLVDLDAGYDVDAVPDPIAWELAKDVAAWMASRTTETVDLHVDGFGTIRLGPGPSASGSISGRAQQIAGWLTGRAGADGLNATGPVPDLPRWL
jgi:maleylpyruvate isomerase